MSVRISKSKGLTDIEKSYPHVFCRGSEQRDEDLPAEQLDCDQDLGIHQHHSTLKLGIRWQLLGHKKLLEEQEPVKRERDAIHIY